MDSMSVDWSFVEGSSKVKGLPYKLLANVYLSPLEVRCKFLS